MKILLGMILALITTTSYAWESYLGDIVAMYDLDFKPAKVKLAVYPDKVCTVVSYRKEHIEHRDLTDQPPVDFGCSDNDLTYDLRYSSIKVSSYSDRICAKFKYKLDKKSKFVEKCSPIRPN